MKKLLTLAILLIAVLANAELTATVYPGYTLSANERPTVTTLNLMARPTVVVSGTLGGTNVGLAANSVSGAMLMNSVVDGTTVEFFDNGGVTAIRIKSAGVSTNQISSAMAGDGLGGGSGFPLSNKVDNVRIQITNDVVTLATNIPLNYLAATSNTIPMGYYSGFLTNLPVTQFYSNVVKQATFTTTGIGVAAGSLYNAAHNLGTVPTFLRFVLVMGSTTELGYSVGDEVDLMNASQTAANPQFSYGANSTNIWLVCESTTINIGNKTTGARANITPSRWTIKGYARP